MPGRDCGCVAWRWSPGDFLTYRAEAFSLTILKIGLVKRETEFKVWRNCSRAKERWVWRKLMGIILHLRDSLAKPGIVSWEGRIIISEQSLMCIVAHQVNSWWEVNIQGKELSSFKKCRYENYADNNSQGRNDRHASLLLRNCSTVPMITPAVSTISNWNCPICCPLCYAP